MEEPEDTFVKGFSVYQRHICFLEQINNNTSLALRTVLDSIMNGELRKRKKQILDHVLLYSCFGLIFVLISNLFNNTIVFLISILIGLFLVIYSIIGGVISALQLSNETKLRRKC